MASNLYEMEPGTMFNPHFLHERMSVLCPTTTEDRHALSQEERAFFGLEPLEFVTSERDGAAPVTKPTLVVGDVHGHFDRLEALLLQEGILGPCPDCDGFGNLPTGEVQPNEFGEVDCDKCKGDGTRRINFDVEVVQIGDLGHFGQDASPTGDMMCYKYALDWFDTVLWGNHDRAVIDSHHVFGGYLSPGPEIKHLMHGLYAMDKLKLAHVAHGWLLTHAGLVQHWQQQKGIDFNKDDPVAFANWMNENDWWPGKSTLTRTEGLTDAKRSAIAVRDAISCARGGWSPTGGTLWRDDREEKLYKGMRQIYGHTAARDGAFHFRHPEKRDRIRVNPKADDFFLPSDTVGINIDIGSKYGQHLGGVWLPDLRLVRVDL